MTFSSGTFSPGPQLPQATEGHCVIELNATHTFLAGGKYYCDDVDEDLYGDFYHPEAFFYAGEEWIPLANLPGEFSYYPCSAYEDRETGAPMAMMFSPSSTVVYDANADTWQTGPSYPKVKGTTASIFFLI